ncbi:sugar phosphate isomerase/epimerase family protein [Paenibacillus glycinis]|uniref:TIM barrel protein n=1 Tax=Paenibacillus glycinis TaxID=2697035 RepID=A0ABW9XM12_9BACL|nr:sugar phosphate isomerase/epimerase family protein [Paenibacillus glycinis]NBD23665.1 TIM barrel protein [Paenibacillus glycinis]
MHIEAMGVSLLSNDLVSSMDRLEAKLAKIEELGFRAVELPIHGMNVIVNGRLLEERLERYVKLFKQFSLRVTTHAPFEINLFRQDGLSKERQVLQASIEVSGALGAAAMAYHPARFVGEEELIYRHAWPVYTEEEQERLLEQEREELRLAGDLARSRNVRIGMENMRPYLDCPNYCYAVRPSLLAEQMARIGHDRIGLTLDTGHLLLAVRMYGLDLQAELEAMAPHVFHLHVHDNFGKANFSIEKNQYDLIPHGRGDMHMPIGEGEVPFGEIASTLAPFFAGTLIHEVREAYEPSWPLLIGRTAAMLAQETLAPEGLRRQGEPEGASL